jgi:two-component sensor histidine kinase
VPAGHIDIRCSDDNDVFVLTWQERGGPRVEHRADGEGFGSVLARLTVTGQLGGEITRDWHPAGLTLRLSMPRNRLLGQ